MLVVPVVGIVGEDEVALAVCLAVGYVLDPNIADIREILGFQRIPLNICFQSRPRSFSLMSICCVTLRSPFLCTATS